MASRRYRMIADIPDGDDTRECRITFRHTPGHPARWYLRNGDPGYPAEPDELDLIDVEPTRNGQYVAHTTSERVRIQELAGDWLETDEGREAALDHVETVDERAAEYAAELRRE